MYKMLRVLSLLAFILLAPISLKAQVLQILQFQSDQPVSYASVIDKTKGDIFLADEHGRVDLEHLDRGTEVVISAIGFQSITIALSQLESIGYKVYLTQHDLLLEEVVVSASKFKRKTSDLASRVQVVSKSRVDLLNPQTAADLLGSSGAIFIQKSQAGGGSPMIRGFATNRLLYAVDGVRMNTAIFRAGNIQNVISLDPFTIEQTEVLFGPGSVIYGSDAIGGVMSFSTLTPRLASDHKLNVAGNVITRYSSANQEKTLHSDITMAKSRFSSVTSVTISNFGDLKMGSNGSHDYTKKFLVINEANKDKIIPNPDPYSQAPSGYTQTNFMQKLRFQMSKDWDIQYGLHVSNLSSFSRYDRLIEISSNGDPLFAVWNYGPQLWQMHQLTLTHESKIKVYDRMAFRAAYQYFEESRIDRRFNNARLRTQQEQVHAYSLNLDFEKHLGKHHLNYGAEYVLNKVDSKATAIHYITNADIPVADRYPRSDWYSGAAYVSYQYHIGKKSILEAGSRLSVFGLNSDFSRLTPFYNFGFEKISLNSGNVSGNIGFVHKFSNNFKLSMQIGSGFRAPNVDDMGKLFDFTAGNINVPNSDLKNEQVYNAEVNLNGLISQKVKWDFSTYYTYLDDAMVRRPYAVNGKDSILYNGNLSKSFAIQNAAFARILGTHFGIEVNISKTIYTGAKINYQYGVEALDNGEQARSRHAAPAFGEFKLGYLSKKLNAEFYTIFSDQISHQNLNPEEITKPFIYAVDEQGNPYAPSWFTLNLKAKYHIFKFLVANIGVENIADIMYRPYSSGIASPGRNFVLSFSVHW